jgi:hypothetical protein
MWQAKGPWVGIEVEDLDRFGVDTLPAGSQAGVHYFHLTHTDPVQTEQDARTEAEYEIRAARQRKVETIREGIRKAGGRTQAATAGAGAGVGLGLGLGGGLGGGIVGGGGTGGLGGMGGERGSGRGSKRSASPFVSPAQGQGEWVGKEGLRALFVRPSEVVYVVGAE